MQLIISTLRCSILLSKSFRPWCYIHLWRVILVVTKCRHQTIEKFNAIMIYPSLTLLLLVKSTMRGMRLNYARRVQRAAAKKSSVESLPSVDHQLSVEPRLNWTQHCWIICNEGVWRNHWQHKFSPTLFVKILQNALQTGSGFSYI